MNLKHNFVLVKLNKIEETFTLKLKILYFILFLILSLLYWLDPEFYLYLNNEFILDY